jgi:hypothetical protein
MTNNLAALAGVVVSGAVAVAAINFPYRLGLLFAMVLGMATAMMVDKFLPGSDGDKGSGGDDQNKSKGREGPAEPITTNLREQA